MASTLNRSIICVNAANFTTSRNDCRAVGRLQELFATAERTQSIIFIDEIEAIGSRETSNASQVPVINTLLTLLDGFEESNTLVISATNKPDMLDPALLRPGRLHTRIKVDVLRKAEDRAKLIDIFCRKAGRNDLSESLKALIVRATEGWAPANILSVMREMFDLASDDAPTRSMFAQARNTEFAGDETQRLELTDEEKRHVSIHEAGHALVATLRGQRWLHVTINGVADNLGFLERLREGSVGKSKEKLLEAIDVALAGNAAERILGTVAEGSQSDFCKATDYAKRIVRGGFCDDEELAMTPDYTDSEHDWARIRPKVSSILMERKKIVASLLTKNKAALKSVADELVHHGTLFQEDVVAILRRKASRRTMRKDTGRE